ETLLENKGIFKSKRLFKCILGLNDLESKVLSYLLKHDKVSTAELTEILELDRSSIQRVLQKLIELKLITRKSISLKKFCEIKGLEENNKRGYLYIYDAKNIKTIKKQFNLLLDKWYNYMRNYIQNLDSLFDCYEENGELC
ncbi:MAG: MarR family transcriptional regulator, partial [Candidatus Lokiarchaeota archaeon]|nr:MarR family transcriptional regulator [Candidatus Lokiarchaeota archaeon]